MEKRKYIYPDIAVMEVENPQLPVASNPDTIGIKDDYDDLEQENGYYIGE